MSSPVTYTYLCWGEGHGDGDTGMGMGLHSGDVWPRETLNSPRTQRCTPVLLTFPSVNHLHLLAGGKL